MGRLDKAVYIIPGTENNRMNTNTVMLKDVSVFPYCFYKKSPISVADGLHGIRDTRSHFILGVESDKLPPWFARYGRAELQNSYASGTWAPGSGHKMPYSCQEYADPPNMAPSRFY